MSYDSIRDQANKSREGREAKAAEMGKYARGGKVNHGKGKGSTVNIIIGSPAGAPSAPPPMARPSPAVMPPRPPMGPPPGPAAAPGGPPAGLGAPSAMPPHRRGGRVK